jgi:hypothetical protein
MLTYYFINNTIKQICKFDNTKPVLIELKRVCAFVKGWILHHNITVDADRAHIDYLVIQKDYEFLGC